MLEFQKPQLSDKPWIDELLSYSNFRGSEYNFTNLFIWNGIYGQKVARHGDFLLVRACGRAGCSYFYPAGRGDVKEAIDLLREDAAAQEKPFRLICLSRRQMEDVEQLYPDKFDFIDERDGYDYLYDIDRMADLQAQAETIPGSGDTSTIVWLGYDAPDHIPAAVLPGYATDGAPALRDFTLGLRESHQGPDANVTVIGHSYGSTVVGTADALAGEGLAVNDIIAMGSPGMGYEARERQGWFDGPMVDDISDMHIGADHFWAGAAANDPVTYTEVHGNSPVDWSFGGQRITTDGASGHSEYWNPGTEALRNQAYILTGNYDQVDTVGRRFG